MEVEGCLVAHGVEFAQESFRIREQLPVPTVSGPTPGLSESVRAKPSLHGMVGVMPVHVHNHHVHWNAALPHFMPKVKYFLVRESPVTAPPVTQCVLWRKGDLACYLCEIFQGRSIIVAVSEKVPVNAVSFRALCNPVLPVGFRGLKKVAGTLIYNCPAVPGDDSVFQPFCVKGGLLKPKAAIQGACGALEVALWLHSGSPAAFPEDHLKVFLGELSAFVSKGEALCLYGKGAVLDCCGVCRDGKVAVHYGK